MKNNKTKTHSNWIEKDPIDHKIIHNQRERYVQPPQKQQNEQKCMKKNIEVKNKEEKRIKSLEVLVYLFKRFDAMEFAIQNRRRP